VQNSRGASIKTRIETTTNPPPARLKGMARMSALVSSFLTSLPPPIHFQRGGSIPPMPVSAGFEIVSLLRTGIASTCASRVPSRNGCNPCTPPKNHFTAPPAKAQSEATTIKARRTPNQKPYMRNLQPANPDAVPETQAKEPGSTPGGATYDFFLQRHAEDKLQTNPIQSSRHGDISCPDGRRVFACIFDRLPFYPFHHDDFQRETSYPHFSCHGSVRGDFATTLPDLQPGAADRLGSNLLCAARSGEWPGMRLWQ